ncbi:MAG: RNA polymerase sigma factor [Blastocatellia bacterium]
MKQIYKERGKLTVAPADEVHQPHGQPAGLTDDELVGSATRGDERAFDELVARHRPMIFRVVRRFFQRHDEIEELAHLSLVEAWFAIGSYRGGGAHSFAAWLARITTNSCYDELRRRRRRPENVFSQLSEGEMIFLFEQKSAGAAAGEVEARLISRDLADKLLNSLEPDDRQVFVMLKSENYSVAEIARNIGWTEAKVKNRVHRSRSILERRSRRLV